MRRIIRKHRAPVAHVALDVSLIPTAAFARLDEDRFERSFPDVVRRRPPCFHLFHKHAECMLDRRLHAHTLTNDGFYCCVCHASLLGLVSPRQSERRASPRSTSGQNAPAIAPRLLDSIDRAFEFRPCCPSPAPHPSARASAAKPRACSPPS